MVSLCFDVAVVGGGVVGCAIAREFALAGASTVLLEIAGDILAGASKGNSAILHTGFDAVPGSLEARLVAESHALYLDLHRKLNLPLLETGAHLVAWTEDQEAQLPAILAAAHENGVADVRILTAAAARRRTPALGPAARAAVEIPREYVIDPWSAPLAYLTQAVENGATALFGAGVTDGRFDGAVWRLQTGRGEVRARFVVNAAGLYGDWLERSLLGASRFAIHPRKGQFVVYDKAASKLLDTILLPVPTSRTKGVVVCPTIFGNVLVGPTAEEQDSRADSSTDEATLRRLKAEAERILPGLAGMPVTAIYAGIRPATEEKDYRIFADAERHWITVGGIRSTGLTAALGIARHVLGLHGGAFTPPPEIVWPQMPNLAEHLPRDHQAPGRGEIVCHCELVTRREIEAALESPLPPSDPAGLKRRTRAMMGRCQGFHCAARLSALVDARLSVPLGAGPLS
ncbi:NAD(P)/FAD-dependent oxidoreductase [Zavarzinia aquatilis]|uniref:FAD/NAD(P)-binding oxidoreductase n=1 Tax=Zavarzinia aquatilis TaxID=2211142 RepID=A0A317EDS3_9PROT|nr:NAD(P)/FAD-dependent oxidoreductase [Zavarzinia aquatilis]PWR24752.1 FAD/NAD(P)-binding oxidoreductase [Zavarzinia aquatilis]